jgi:pantoate--beta-alanine ligase
MKHIDNIADLKEYLNWCHSHHKSVGFVPTMGALHAGHLSLVEMASTENDIVIVSIFVNPTQFNNSKDLAKYPRTIEKDTALLNSTDCNVIFAPNVEEVYSADFEPRDVNLGKLDNTLEGHFRPGHFNGVVAVVQRLFDLVEPNKAYFGRKDFQQVAVIKSMVAALKYTIDIRVGDTIREDSGLAMSSRNMLLSDKEKEEALVISKVLFQMKDWAKVLNPQDCAAKARIEINNSSLILEYLEIVHPLTFEKIHEWTTGATVCVVAYCGAVRLIDNLELVS